jgi:putative flippase GtrA
MSSDGSTYLTMVSTEAPVRSRSLGGALGSFALIGGIGFAIEAALLTALTHYAAWTPWQARMPSFCTAVLVTWALNRRHTFAGRGLQRRSVEALSYAAIQICGALVNLAIFGWSLKLLPQLSRIPVVALGIGAAGGFVFNFAVSNAVLYARGTRGLR